MNIYFNSEHRRFTTTITDQLVEEDVNPELAEAFLKFAQTYEGIVIDYTDAENIFIDWLCVYADVAEMQILGNYRVIESYLHMICNQTAPPKGIYQRSAWVLIHKKNQGTQVWRHLYQCIYNVRQYNEKTQTGALYLPEYFNPN